MGVSARARRGGRPEKCEVPMRNGLPASIVSLSVAIAVASLMSVPLAGQAARSAAKTTKPDASKAWTPPHTAWGDPDLQGQWNSQTSTPLQRPLTGVLAE